MTLPNYLTLENCDGAYGEPCLPGETGLALSGSQRPSAQLTAWLAGADISGKAKIHVDRNKSVIRRRFARRTANIHED